MLSVESTHMPVSKPARSINEMKCPFRVDKNGEFMPCCGDACMAYYEYENTPWLLSQPTNAAPQPVLVRVCRRLAPVSTPYGCVV